MRATNSVIIIQQFSPIHFINNLNKLANKFPSNDGGRPETEDTWGFIISDELAEELTTEKVTVLVLQT